MYEDLLKRAEDKIQNVDESFRKSDLPDAPDPTVANHLLANIRDTFIIYNADIFGPDLPLPRLIAGRSIFELNVSPFYRLIVALVVKNTLESNPLSTCGPLIVHPKLPDDQRLLANFKIV